MPDSSGVEVLPQGAPTSPVLSNIVLKSLDKKMSKLAERMGCMYSRYADDITFSHSKSIRRMSPFWQTRIYKIIAKYGLKVNEKKTKTFVTGTRQEVTGVVVSDKINVSRFYIKQLRVLLHLWEKYGYAQAQLIFTRDFCNGMEKNLINVIDGKINYLEMIKGKQDSTYRKLKNRFKNLKWKEKTIFNQNTKRNMNIIYLHGLASSGQSNTAKKLRELLPDDNVITPDIPVNPIEALQLLLSLTGEYHTDNTIITGTSMVRCMPLR